jgi:hypothetical protein
MDASGGGATNADVERLNEKDKAELRQFLANQSQVAQIQSRKHQGGFFSNLLVVANPGSRDACSHQYVLEKVHNGCHKESEARQGRRQLYRQLRRSLSRYQLPYHETSKQHAAINVIEYARIAGEVDWAERL